MLRKTECYVPVCDVCGKDVDVDCEMLSHFDTEADATEHALDREEYGGSGCEMVDGKLCCSHCWHYDDDDEIAIRPKENPDDN